MRLTPLPAFDDNYIWAADHGDTTAIIVDPGQPGPVLAAAAQGLRPAAVLLTHHHDDHIGGVAALLERWPQLPVYAPNDARIDLPCRRVVDGQSLELPVGQFQVIAVPGHTRSHVAYVAQDVVFSGDTLFSLGCGRMFEGTPPQFHASLQRLAALPPQTRVCCGHEYTLSNAAFALHVDPSNAALRRRHEEIQAMRAASRPTLPVTLASELACNPFLRTDSAPVRDAVARRLGRAPIDAAETFAELRLWKDDFRA